MNISLSDKIQTMLPLLNERQKRLFLADEARTLGYGGISGISRISGMSKKTIAKGIEEIRNHENIDTDSKRCRKQGGGRKSIEHEYPNIKSEIEKLLEAHTKGGPQRPLKYSSKSLRKIEEELRRNGQNISHTKIAELLKSYGYSLQSNKKELATKKTHPDRNEQFEYISKRVSGCGRTGCPVLSIDAKKKETVGNYKNTGREYHKKGEAPLAYDHGFQSELGKATPYGIFDIFKNAGFVNVTLSGDTASFAVSSLNRWWKLVGVKSYARAKEILITAGCGGSNGYRVRLWKYKLQEFANKIHKKITVLHFPPGTSKWNKIEHRLFSFISKNWRGKPLINTAVIISLINATRTEKGLTVKCVLDNKKYKTKEKVSDEGYAAINICHHKFHGEWNYTISPQK